MVGKRILLGMLVLFVTALAVGSWQRQALLAWWHVRQLAQADEANRNPRVERVLVLDSAATPRLVEGLTASDENVCVNLEAALVGLAKRWKTQDPRAELLLESLRDRFTEMSPAGRISALHAATTLLNQTEDHDLLPVAIAQAAGALLRRAETETTLRAPTLHLARALLAHVPQGQWLDSCRKLAVDGLRDPQVSTRVAALHLLLCESLRAESEIMNQALPLLRDPEVEVRRAAVLALGSAQEFVADDDLLPLLHDPDVEVQQLCELALRGRGLQEHQLKLARLISDDSPGARLQVLQFLRGSGGVEPSVWLRRLSNDPAPAVRAAAVRAAAAHPQVDLRERLLEIMQQDVSPTVRELAAHYLARLQK